MAVGNLAEGLEHTDLSALGPYELGLELNKIDHDAAAFTDAAIKAQRAVAEAEVRVLYDPQDIDSKAQAKMQKAVFNAAKMQLQQLSKRQSRIQTLLRTMPS